MKLPTVIMQSRKKYNLQKQERCNSLQDMAGTYRAGVPEVCVYQDVSEDQQQVEPVKPDDMQDDAADGAGCLRPDSASTSYQKDRPESFKYVDCGVHTS